MDHVIERLQQKLDAQPITALRDTLLRLTTIRSQGSLSTDSWGAIQTLFTDLERRGLWDTAGDDARLLRELQFNLTGTQSSNMTNEQLDPHRSTLDASFTFPTAPYVHPLHEELRATQFLHFLATEPKRVLPPGKSLLSALSRPRNLRYGDEDTRKVHERVTDVAHRAFWDEALESLSEPTPAKQIQRLQRLYADLLEALTPLLPEGHLVLVTLSDPLSPTSSPLVSALRHLREALVALRRRCAPVRDAEFDRLLSLSDNPPPSSDVPGYAKLVVDVTRGIHQVSELMRDDLAQAVIGFADEKQLEAHVRSTARSSECELLLQCWTREQVLLEWSKWVAGDHPDSASPPTHDSVQVHVWARRFIQALGFNESVSCPLPDISYPAGTNVLPSVFLFCIQPLFRLQNFLQALVICASLRSLIRIPARGPISTTTTESEELGFMERVWALLRTELEEEGEGLGETRVVNLADEVVRAQRLSLTSAPGGASETLDEAEEARLRGAVDRTLQPRDPVFTLLMKRLLEALGARLSEPPSQRTQAPMSVLGQMKTGREERGGQRPGLRIDLSGGHGEDIAEEFVDTALEVKGFADPVLAQGVMDVLRDVRQNAKWVQHLMEVIIREGMQTRA